jgi:hypothetical protein
MTCISLSGVLRRAVTVEPADEGLDWNRGSFREERAAVGRLASSVTLSGLPL